MNEKPSAKLFIQSSEKLLSADWIEACFNDWDLGDDDDFQDNMTLFEPVLVESDKPITFKTIPDYISPKLLMREEIFGGLIFDPTTSRVIQTNKIGFNISKIWQAEGKTEVINELINMGYPSELAVSDLCKFTDQLLSLGQNR
jgi:hypothetical protein